MYYHASAIKNITRLEPRKSNHGVPLIYFSTKRENTLVYLSNAIEKYCREIDFKYEGPCSKWGPYGFTPEGILRLEEYYPNAIEETYSGVSGYIYSVVNVNDSGFELNIPFAVTSNEAVEVKSSEFVFDAYEEILKAEKEGKIVISRYSSMDDRKKEWIAETINREYMEAADHPEYRKFLEGKFGVNI